MNRFRVALMVGVIALCTSALRGQEDEASTSNWHIDMEEALRIAAEEDKDLLVNFTGSDWCVWCIRLEQEVFDQEGFMEKVTENFVLVKLDFPRDKSAMEEETIQQNEDWKSRMEVSGFPSIMLLDEQGRPFAKSGYQEGGPDPYLDLLTQMRNIRVERDELLAQAEAVEGTAKAELLDQALSLLDEDLATTHYEEMIKEIVALDADDEVGLRTKYFAAQDAEARKRILNRISLAARTLPPDAAIQTIDDALGEMKLPPTMRVEALQTKLLLLRTSGNHEAYMLLLDEMIDIEGIPSVTQQRLVVQKVYALVGVGQQDEALETLDNVISSTAENLQLCMAKGELLDRLGRHELALAAYDEAIRGAEHDPEIAVEIYIAKSDVLASLGQLDDALGLLGRVVGNEDTPDYLKPDLLIQKALLLREVGRIDEAELAEYQAVDFAETADERAELLLLIEQIRKDDDN